MATEIDTYFIPSADWANVVHSVSASGTAADGPSVAGTYRALVAIDAGDITIAAPDAFTSGQWSVAGNATEGDLVFTISALPNQNGKPITKFQYALDGDQGSPTWADLPAGTATGTYTATGVTDGTYTSTIAIRAVNAIGNGAVSDLKTATVADGSSSNLVTNGTFDSATNWSGTNWTIASGKATHTPGSTSPLVYGDFTPIEGNQYQITYTVLDWSAGTIRVQLQGVSNQSGTLRGSDGTYQETLTAAAGNSNIRFLPGSTFAGAIDNVIVEDVTP